MEYLKISERRKGFSNLIEAVRFSDKKIIVDVMSKVNVNRSILKRFCESLEKGMGK
jgi:hypothetical protein